MAAFGFFACAVEVESKTSAAAASSFGFIFEALNGIEPIFVAVFVNDEFEAVDVGEFFKLFEAFFEFFFGVDVGI